MNSTEVVSSNQRVKFAQLQTTLSEKMELLRLLIAALTQMALTVVLRELLLAKALTVKLNSSGTLQLAPTGSSILTMRTIQ